MYSDVHRHNFGFQKLIDHLMERKEVERDGAIGSYAYSLSASGRCIAGVCAAWQDAYDASRGFNFGRPFWAWSPITWLPNAIPRTWASLPAQPWDPAQRVVVLVDSKEPKPEVQKRQLGICCAGVRYRVETLITGDFMFLLEPEAESNSDPLGGKRVLPVVIERKTPSDLTASLNEGRYDSQIHKMVASEIALKVYLVEGDLSKVTLEQHDHLDKLAAVQGFHVIYTKNGWKTALTLGQIARLLNEAVKSGAISPASLPTMDEVGWRIVWGVRAAAAAVAEGVAAAEEEREAAAAEEVVDAKAKVTNIAGAVTTRRRTEAVASRSQPALPTVCRASCSW